MPSQLVDDVRALIRARTDAGRPVTALERTFILAAVAPRVAAGADVVDELEDAIADTRRTCLTANTPQEVRRSIQRLLAAARATLDYTPVPPAPTEAAPESPRPHRLDVDGYADNKESPTMPMHARPNAEAAANALLDHITSLDGPQVLAEARCIAASADGLDELGVDPTVSIMFRTLGVLTSRLDATSADAVDGAIPPADSCTCHNGADVSTRTLMARVLKATALDAALGHTAN